MAIPYVRPVSRAARWSARLGLFALVLFLVATAAHRIGGVPTPDFVALFLVAALIALASTFAALIGLARLWQVGAEGGRASLAGLAASAVVLAPAAAGAFAMTTHPRLYDITSDSSDPPAWIFPPDADQSWLADRPEPSAAMRALQTEAYPELSGRRYDGAIDRVLPAIRKVLADMRFSVTGEKDPNEAAAPPGAELPVTPPLVRGRPLSTGIPPLPTARPDPDLVAAASEDPTGTAILIQAETRSLVFGFPNDAVVRIVEEAETSFVDMRFAARYGLHDLGTGAATIEAFFQALDTELLGFAAR